MKKIFVYLLVGVLTTSVVFSNYYKSAHAMEWVSGALSFAEVLTWVLGSIGITCTVSDYSTEVDKTRDQFWEEYEQQFYAYVDEHEGDAASDRFIAWKNKLCQGVLDKSSEYWGMFKSWASDLVNGTTSSAPAVGASYHDTLVYLNDFFGFSLVENNSYINTNIYSFLVEKNNTSNNYYVYMFTTNNNLQNLITNRSGTLYCNYNRSNSYIGYYNIPANGSGTSSASISNSYFALYNKTTGDNYISSNVPYVTDSNYNLYSVPFGDSSGVADENFEGVTTNVNDLDVISSDGVDEDNPEVTLPYPGVSDSDDEISKDAYQDIIDAINDGTITQEEGVEKIQELLKVITYDTVTDKVIPPQKDPDTGEDKTKDEVIKENKENMGFTLAGLENVFPFCIPFDIYAFMTLLVADPEAPEIDFPIKSVNGEVEEIHIDLSPFDSVAVVVRYIFDFLFIIGLGILTRSLIGGGSSD